MNKCAVGALVLLSAIAGCGAPDAPEASTNGSEPVRFTESCSITPDGVRLYLRTSGSGPDTVVVPLAAWLAAEMGPLIPGRTLVFYDPPNRGRSDVVESTRLGIEQEVRDLEFVRSQLGVERVALIGWSYLGAVVALYAAEYPDHVNRLVQIGPMPPTDELSRFDGVRGSPADSADLAFVADLAAAGRPASDPVGYCRESVIRMMIRPMMGRPEAASRARLDACIYWNEWPDQLRRTAALLFPQDWDYSDRARRVTAPVLIVHGTEDPNAPVEGGRAWAALLPNARLVEIEGVGHAPWLEAPEDFFSEVDAFLGAP